MVQHDLKFKNKIAKFTIGAGEGVGTAFYGLSNYGSILNPLGGMTTVYGPSLQGFAIKEADPPFLFLAGGVENKCQAD